MKLFFLKQDSLYKIFTTLEKTPKHSHVQIFIESENQFFNNVRRSKQIDGILSKRDIKATFIAQNSHQKNFFEEHRINHEVKKENKIRRFFNLLYWFFFNIKKFHLHTYQHKNYSFFAIFWAEILLILVAWYGIYSLILPQTTVTLTPSYEMNEIVYNFRYMYPNDISTYPLTGKHIVIPLYTWTIPNISTNMILDKKINTDGTMVKGTVRIVNTTSTALSLKINTQLIDDFGIEYTTNDKISIPASNGKDQAGVAYISITSKDNPTNNALVQQHGASIALWHRLLIKNLRQSFYTKQVYAEASEWFNISQYKQPWFILMSEIGELQKWLYNSLYEKRKEYVTSDAIPEWWIMLPFESFIWLTGCDYNAIGDTTKLEELSVMSGSLTCSITFTYVRKEDVINGMKEYISKRSTNARKVVNIQNNFINFFDILTGEYNAYIIPTRVNIIESYNLQSDTNNIIPMIKDQIIGKSKEDALRSIETFPEIEKWAISISPFWYSSVTGVKSRIRMIIKEQNDSV